MSITFDCYNNVRAIHFPPGEINSGGSCDFTTKACRKHCGYKINQFELETYRTFMSMSPLSIALEIRDELQRYDCRMLSWFATGDCPEILTDKIAFIFDFLQEEGFIQCGFTRNQVLWERLLPLADIALGLTVENHRAAVLLSAKGLVAVPDYASWTVTLYKKAKAFFNCGGGYGIGGCGANFVTINASTEEIYPEDCGLCHANKRGCFTQC